MRKSSLCWHSPRNASTTDFRNGSNTDAARVCAWVAMQVQTNVGSLKRIPTCQIAPGISYQNNWKAPASTAPTLAHSTHVQRSGITLDCKSWIPATRDRRLAVSAIEHSVGVVQTLPPPFPVHGPSLLSSCRDSNNSGQSTPVSGDRTAPPAILPVHRKRRA